MNNKPALTPQNSSKVSEILTLPFPREPLQKKMRRKKKFTFGNPFPPALPLSRSPSHSLAASPHRVLHGERRKSVYLDKRTFRNDSFVSPIFMCRSGRHHSAERVKEKKEEEEEVNGRNGWEGGEVRKALHG